MGKLQDIRKLQLEDFEEKDREIIEKIAGIDNGFKDDFVAEFNGNVDFENRRDKLVTFELKVDASGVPIGNAKFAHKVQYPGGLTVVSVTNLDDPSSTGYPTAHPWIVPKALTAQVIEISKMIGLKVNDKYRINVLVHSKV